MINLIISICHESCKLAMGLCSYCVCNFVCVYLYMSALMCVSLTFRVFSFGAFGCEGVIKITSTWPHCDSKRFKQ